MKIHFLFLLLVVLLNSAFNNAVPIDTITIKGLYEPSNVKPLQGGPLKLGSDAELEYVIYKSVDKASFSLRIRNTTTLNVENERAWVGFGFGEPGSGGYLGADIVTVQFAADPTPDKSVRLRSNMNCRIVDRYIPFAAFPLGEGMSNAPQFQVKEDKVRTHF